MPLFSVLARYHQKSEVGKFLDGSVLMSYQYSHHHHHPQLGPFVVIYGLSAPVTAMKDTVDASSRASRSHRLHHLRQCTRAPLAEFLGTFLIFLIGFTGTLSSLAAGSPVTSSLTVPLSWGLGGFLAVITTMPTSGAHLSPAVTLLLIIYRGFPKSRAWGYVPAQFLGAITGTAVALGLSYDRLQGHLRSLTPFAISGDHNLIPHHAKMVGSTLFTGPKGITLIAAFFNEFTAAALLGIAIFSLEVLSSDPDGGLLEAFCMCWIVVALALSFGGNTGACMNPFRDLAPRLIAACAGCGWRLCFEFTAETGFGWWLYGPFGADILGLLCGGGIYTLVVGAGVGEQDEEEGDRAV
jgi:aquaglyceroporin related protein